MYFILNYFVICLVILKEYYLTFEKIYIIKHNNKQIDLRKKGLNTFCAKMKWQYLDARYTHVL